MAIRSIALLVLLLSTSAAAALEGSLDPGFNAPNGFLGIYYSGTLTENLRTDAMMLQPDRHLVVLGSHSEGTAQGTLELVRLTPQGSYDNVNFPQVTIAGNVPSPRGVGIARQPGGKFLVLADGVARGANEFALYRFLENGAPDLAFGTGGKLLVPFTLLNGGSVQATKLLVDASGRILLVGTYGGVASVGQPFAGVMVVMRLGVDGALDGNFANGGQLAITRFSELQSASPTDGVTGAELGNDGSLTLAGYTQSSVIFVGPPGPGASLQITAKIALARVRDDGSLAPGFGNGGVVMFDTGMQGLAGAVDLALEPDGRVVVVTNRSQSLAAGFIYVWRFLSGGGLDLNYGTLGKTEITATDVIPYPVAAAGVIADGAGRMLVHGFFASAGVNKTLVARLTSTGALDTGFGSGLYGTGVLILHTPQGGATNQDHPVALMDQDRLVLGGRYQNSNNYYYQLLYRLAGATVFSDGFEE